MNSNPHSSRTSSSVAIQVEDDRTGMHLVTLKRALLDHMRFTQSKNLSSAHRYDWYSALAHMVRDRIVHRWIETEAMYAKSNAKRVYYLSAEFLTGRLLASNLLNLGIYDLVQEIFTELNLNLIDILEQEPDPALGNGGLGRLAACFLESMATLGFPGMGYGIRYEFGIFRQEIKNGWQIEHPDEWLKYGFPWEIVHPEDAVTVHFGGYVQESTDEHGRFRVQWVGTQKVIGIPFDTPVAGFGSDVDNVNTLRLWRARASEEFDLAVFNDGDYRKAVEEKAISESISKVLYPNDQSIEGKLLRLKQQYFFVCCSIHDIVLNYLRKHVTLDDIEEKIAIQLNDTHPVIAIAELMRVFLDQHCMQWERAWDKVVKIFGYTNHTLLSEALERWPIEIFEQLLPRHFSIIYEINRRFQRQVMMHWPNESRERIERMAIVAGKHIHMARLAVVGSHSVNGVAALHSHLVQTDLLKDFAELWPERFNNKTNGVTPRRWLLQANPLLAQAITNRIGTGWVTHLDELKNLVTYLKDTSFHQELSEIKRKNKEVLAAYVQMHNGIEVNLNSMFDVQVKRLHEYKRQLLNCMHVIALYNRIKKDPFAHVVPRTVIFGGKAAPGYVMAKMHIKLIHDVADVINHDPDVGDKLKVIFLSDYKVSLAEKIIPATDLSEQISTAGKEASGTGNMKFQMNGALTIGTLDGANIEIREEVGEENFFLFGRTAPEIATMTREGYKPKQYIEQSTELSQVIERIQSGFFSPEQPGLYQPIVQSLMNEDTYFLCADFDSYVACQEHVAQAYLNPLRWSEKTLINIAKSGKFSSDRTIREYAQEIWGLEPVQVKLES